MKGDNISIRLRGFAAQVVRLCRTLPADPASKHILRQLVRAATAGGANYEEARGAESRADFIHKMAVANKEVRESLYWLRLLGDAEILTSSIRTARRHEASSCGEPRPQYMNGEQGTGN